MSVATLESPARPRSRSNPPEVAPTLGYRPGLDVVRFLAALWVMLSHTHACKGGGHAVAIFFVLSGYLIGGQLYKERSRSGTIGLNGFYFKRITRIWLPYFVVLFGMIALFVARGQHHVPRFTERLVGALTYTYNLINDVRGDIHPTWGSFNQIWSLSIEEQFYLVAPLMFLCLPLRWLPAANAALFALFLFVSPNYAGLFAGVLLATMLERGPVAAPSSARSALLGLVAVAALAGLFLVGQSSIAATAWPTFLLSAVVVTVAGRMSLPERLHAPLRTIGLMTYSYYLIHGLPGYFLGSAYRRAAGAVQVPVWMEIAFGLLALPLSYAFVHWIESPCLRGRDAILKSNSRWIPAAPWIAWGLNIVGLAALAWFVAKG